MLFGKHKRLLEQITYARDSLASDNARLKAEIDAALIAKDMSESEAAICRAQLAQLRVSQHNDGGRVGWMVSAFIPNEVLAQLKKETVDAFILHVARALVRQAIQGIFRMLPHSGKVFGLVFGPVTNENTKEARVRVDMLTGVELNPDTGEAWESGAEVRRIASGLPPVPGKVIMPPGSLFPKDHLKIAGNS